jgi:hypothetical protein
VAAPVTTSGEQWLDTSVSPAQMKVWNGSTWVGVVADELPVSKLQDGAARQLIQTDAAGTGVEWTSNVDVPGTLDVTSTATFDSIASHPLGSAGAPTITFTGDTNTGIYSPGADQVAISTNGTGRLFVDASGNVTVDNSAVNFQSVFRVKTSITGAVANAYFNLGGTDYFRIYVANDTTLLRNLQNTPIAFHTNDTERLRITSAGLVGVGTSSPSADLYVKQSGTDITAASQTVAVFQRSSTTGHSAKISIIAGNAATSDIHFGDTDDEDAGILQYNHTNNNFNFNQALGVGTTSPDVELHIHSTSDNAALEITRGAVGSEYGYALYGSAGATDAALRFFTVENGLGTGEKMRLDASGRLGIGTSSPGDALTVQGTGNSYIGLQSATSGYASLKQIVTDTSAWLRTETSHPLYLGTNQTRAITIDTSQRVGIGTTSNYDDSVLEVRKASGGDGVAIRVTNDTTTNGSLAGIIFTNSTGDFTSAAIAHKRNDNALIFFNGQTAGGGGFANATEAMRLDSSNRLLVGTSSAPTSGQGQYSKLVVQGNSSGSGAGYFAIQRTSASTLIDDVEGVLSFNDNSGNTFAQIICATDATPGTGDYPGRLVFSTTADGASSPTERAKITNAGYFKATSTGDYYGGTSGYHESRTGLANNVSHLFSHSASTGAVYGIQISYAQNKGTSTGDQYITCNDSAALRMEVRGNGGIANFSANNANLSDRNAKKDISPAAGTWDCIKEWEIVNYRYKDQPDDADLNLGVIAQQVAESCPEVITVFQEAKEATEDAPAREERLGVKEQQMYWMAIKALQEAQVRIEALEAEVAALKAQ